MKRTILAAALVALTAGAAHAQQNASLLDFDWLTEYQEMRVQEAHAALHDANQEICSVMVDIYAEHVQRVHGAEGDSVLNEVTDFYERRCAADAFADHIEQSIELHDALHRRLSAHGHGGGHDN